MSKTIAVVLSGCGVFDGAEIHESVLTLLALHQAGASYQCFAPDVTQAHVINHLTGEEAPGERNVLEESARIARGQIKPLTDYDPKDFDALMFPGGFGAAKNLSSFAFDGPDMKVLDQVESAITGTKEAGKPIGALCITPAIMAKLFPGAELTIGSDPDVSAALESLGAKHVTTSHAEVVVDESLKLATTPCYMLDATIGQIADGAKAVTEKVLEMA